MISEVQITCVILMGMITLFLACVIDRYTVVGKMYSRARKILTLGTFLVTIHFIIQYWLHKNAVPGEIMLRSLVNLSFGIPMSYLFNMSNYYLLRKGKVDKINWLIGPVAYVLAMITLLVCIPIGEKMVAVSIMALIYAYTLIHYGVLQIIEYFKVVGKIKSKEDLSLLPYIKWTRWSLMVMVIIAFGFPLMTFNTNLLMRSLYGLLSIASGFYYVLSFMGYGINGAVSTNYAEEHGMKFIAQSSNKRTVLDDEPKMERLRIAMEKFVTDERYLRNGITLKEAADEMHVPVTRLRLWFKNSEYETFNKWLLFLRLKKAKEILLADPDMGGDELAYKCGFCDRQYLQLSFRKWTGMTPTQWVKQELNQTSNGKTENVSTFMKETENIGDNVN